MKNIIKAVFILSILLLTSCATMVSGSRQKVGISSNPTLARVYLNGVEVGKTPIQKNLKRNQEYVLTLKIEGYKTYSTVIQRKFNARYLGNLFFPGPIGLIIDPITGAMYKLQPFEIYGTFESGTTFEKNDQDIHIKVTMEVDPNWEKVGQLEKKTEVKE
ncbi:MAG: PEGA domain-containing protein [Bacteroidota bacterium]